MRFIAKAITIIVAVVAVLVAVLLVSPSSMEPCVVPMSPKPRLEGALAPNFELSSTKLFVISNDPSKPSRPESFAYDGEGGLYTGLGDGFIAHISLPRDLSESTLNSVTVKRIVRTGNDDPDCGLVAKESVCGRPLGVELINKTTLVVCDTLGLFLVDVSTGKKTKLNTDVDGVVARLPNAVRYSKDDQMIYFTDSSSKFDRANIIAAVIEGCPRGRVLAHDLKTGTTSVLLADLVIPNGLALTPEGDALLIAEARARILKLYVKGLKKGQVSVWVDSLPGLPDNIIWDEPSQLYFVGFSSRRSATAFSLIDFAADKPWLRKLLLALIPQPMILNFVPKYGIMVMLDKDGQLFHSMHDPTGRVDKLSEAVIIGDKMFLGTWLGNWLGVLELPDKLKARINSFSKKSAAQ